MHSFYWLTTWHLRFILGNKLKLIEISWPASSTNTGRSLEFYRGGEILADNNDVGDIVILVKGDKMYLRHQNAALN